MALEDSVSMIKGVGAKTEQLFAKMDIYTKQDCCRGGFCFRRGSRAGRNLPKDYRMRGIRWNRHNERNMVQYAFFAILLKKRKALYFSGKGIQKIRQPENGAAKALYKGRIR